jgi:hypothetical protein
MAMRIMPPAARPASSSTGASPFASAAGAGVIAALPEIAPTGGSSLRFRSAALAFFLWRMEPEGRPLAGFLALWGRRPREGRPEPFLRALVPPHSDPVLRPTLVAVFPADQFVPEPTEEKQPKQTQPSHDIQQDIPWRVKKI